MLFSVIVPAYNAQDTLPALLDSLSYQNRTDFEVIVVDDGSRDSTSKIVKEYDYNLIHLKKNRGPAFCRNIGVDNAKGEILIFTDSDCRVDRKWMSNIKKHFEYDNTDALMGRLILNPSGYLGDSISSLGFPAGGSLGFDKIWRVDKDCFTESLSSCNCAVRKEIFLSIGGFDETFPYAGGEDSLLAYSLIKLGFKIKYCQDVIVYHEARDSLGDFFKWQFRRGISSHIFSRKVKDRANYISLRLWSTANVIKYNFRDRKIPLIIFLLLTSFLMQTAGFLYGKKGSAV